MSKKKTNTGLILTGSLRQSGVTLYERGGRVIMRTATSDEKRSNTRSQFVQRQKMRHTIELWRMLRCCDLMFTERQTAYLNFASLANRLPAVYVDQRRFGHSSFLMPGIPVSDGTLPAVQLQLGDVDGVPALLTNLKNDDRSYRDELWLYTATQTFDNGFMPRLRFSMRKLTWRDMTLVNGFYVLKGEEYADDTKGWALVRIIDKLCSPQTIITRCTIYQQYTTEEALQVAAESYGGLTKTPLPRR